MLNRVANNPNNVIKPKKNEVNNAINSEIVLGEDDRAPANTSAENKKGILKQNKTFKIVAIAVALITIVGVALGVGLGKPLTDEKAKSAGLEGTISQQEDELANKDSVIEGLETINESNLQKFISNMNENVNEAEQSYYDAEEYFNKIWNGFQTDDSALQELKDSFDSLSLNYSLLLSSILKFEDTKSAYDNGKATIEQLGVAIDEVNNYAGQVEKGGDALYDACDAYNIYQISFSQTDLQNKDAQGLFVDKHFAGSATSIESCTYEKDSGDVTVIVQIKEDPKPGQEAKYFTSVVRGNIGAGKTTKEVTPTNIINALKKDNSFSRTTYSLEMGSSKEESVATAGDQMNSGSIKVEYFANNKYDAKSGTTQVSGGAIVKIYNENGTLSVIKEYEVRLGTFEGKVDQTNEVKKALQEIIIQNGASTSISNAVLGDVDLEAEI